MSRDEKLTPAEQATKRREQAAKRRKEQRERVQAAKEAKERAGDAAERREQAAKKRKAQRERAQAAKEAKERAGDAAERREQAAKRRKGAAGRSKARREQLQAAEGVDAGAKKASGRKADTAKVKSKAQRTAERVLKRREARQRAAERAAQRAQQRAKAKPQEKKGGVTGAMAAAQRAAEKAQRRAKARPQKKGGIVAAMSAAQRAAEKAKRREERRMGQRTRVAATPQKAVGETDDAALTERFEALDARFETLYQAVLLSEVSDDLEDTDSALAELPVTLEILRSRGYAFKNFLEKKIEVLQDQWTDLHERVLDAVDSRSEDLLEDADKAAALSDQARARSGSSATRQLDRCEAVLKRLESKVDAAQQTIEGMYDALDNNVDQTQSQLETIAWTLDQVDEASLDLYPAEAVVAVCQAQLLEQGDDKGPKGIFYLTDERVAFEQKEEVATKKVLFVTTEKEKLQELRFEVALGNVEEVKASEKGRIRRKELLELHFGGDAALRRVHLRLLGGADSDDWQGLIGRVVSGDIAQERVEPKDEAAIEAARSAPTECPTCGAQFTEPIVRGMQSLTCEYCGFIVRL